MATIYDVAKKANVSIGTVSKYLNNTGYINPKKRESIQSAIEELNYSPNRSAKQLKTHVSRDIVIVLPNVTEKLYREILTSTTALLQPQYRVLLELSNDSAVRETELLHDCISNDCAGAILCTCQPQNSALFKKVNKHMPLVFVHREPAERRLYNFLGFNNAETVYSLVSELLNLGHSDIGLYTGDPRFSCESESLDSFLRAYADRKLAPPAENRIFSHPFSEEATFRNIMHLLDSGDYPRIFITTSLSIAKALSEVAFFHDLAPGSDLFIFSLGEDSCYDSIFASRVISTFRPAQTLGTMAAETLLRNIGSPVVFEPVQIRIADSFPCDRVTEYMDRRLNASPAPPVHYTSTLRMAFNQEDAGSAAIKSLLPLYMKQKQVKVEFDPITHNEIYNKIIGEADSPSYDLFSIDCPWLPYLQEKDLLLDLTKLCAQSDLKSRFLPDVLEKVGTYNGKVLGIPYIYSSSLLFYRKDLFEDPVIRDDFYKKFRIGLEPPKNWFEFNVIAKYFTRLFNPASPTLYGTSIFGKFGAALCTELYPRIWAYGGSVFDNYGRVTLYSENNLRAFNNLVETLSCSSPNSLEHKAFDSMEEFAKGNIAMTVAFSSNASIFVDRARARIWDKLGYAPIPSRSPVTSGWCLGIHKESPNAQLAWDFIQWLTSMELSLAYTILGGMSPVKGACDNVRMQRMYPWLKLVQEHYSESIPRSMPAVPGSPILEEIVVDDLLADVIYRHFQTGEDIEYLLLQAHKKLDAYASAHGYPHSEVRIKLL